MLDKKSFYKSLDDELFPINREQSEFVTVGQAYEGISVFGGTGSGKTSGAGRTIALQMLKKGWGGLVLTVKTDEKDNWMDYVKDSTVKDKDGNDRTDDLTIINAECANTIDLLGYEYGVGKDNFAFTAELVATLNSAMEGGQERQKSNEPFWEHATARLLTNAIDLAIFAENQLSLETVVDIIRTSPSNMNQTEECKDVTNGEKNIAKITHPLNIFTKYLVNAETNINKKMLFGQEKRIDFQETCEFWLHEFSSFDPKTRTNVIATLMARLAGLLRSPYRQLFFDSTNTGNITPEMTFGKCDERGGILEKGKIIVLDIPVKKYKETGRFAQVLFKQIWQRAVERRGSIGNPVFLWADEAQFFVTKQDMLFQQTARSSRAATVYLTQSVANYKAVLSDGDNNAENLADSLMGNFQTMIFHSNGCPVTNEYAEKVFAKKIKEMDTMSGDFELSTRKEYQPVLPARKFTLLKKGGDSNSGVVECYIFQAGRQWISNKNKSWVRGEFQQKNVEVSE